MQSPVQIQFKNMEPSEALGAAINKWMDKLDRADPTIIACRVSVEAPSKKKMRGGRYHTWIDIRLPGKEVVVNRNPDLHHSCSDVYVSIRDTFRSTHRHVGMEVRFVEHEGSEVPRASSIRLIGKHHIA